MLALQLGCVWRVESLDIDWEGQGLSLPAAPKLDFFCSFLGRGG